MNSFVANLRAVLGIEASNTAEQRSALLPHDAEEQFLAEATDHADLERRIRVLDRQHQPPVVMTFNH